MTELEHMRTEALKRAPLNEGFEADFVASLAKLATKGMMFTLSVKQRYWLDRLCWNKKEFLRANGDAASIPAEMPVKPDEERTLI
jgi:hypothetical protein